MEQYKQDDFIARLKQLISKVESGKAFIQEYGADHEVEALEMHAGLTGYKNPNPESWVHTFKFEIVIRGSSG